MGGQDEALEEAVRVLLVDDRPRVSRGRSPAFFSWTIADVLLVDDHPCPSRHG